MRDGTRARLVALTLAALPLLVACGGTGDGLDASALDLGAVLDLGRTDAPHPDAGAPDAPDDLGADDLGADDLGLDAGPVDDLGPDGAPVDARAGDPHCAEAIAILDCASGTVAGDTAWGSSSFADYCGGVSASYGGNEAIYGLETATTMRVTVTVTSPATAGDWDLFAFDPGGAACDHSDTCVDHAATNSASEVVHFLATAGERYYLAYDEFTGGDVRRTTPFDVSVECVVPGCGDGFLDPAEACDDGNTTAGDGCSPTCELEAGSWCSNDTTYTPPSLCQPVVCGDGLLDAAEACDDGNTTAGDGCSPTCAIEPGFTCDFGSATACAPGACGDGTLGTSEECDDANATSGDGCSATCALESGFGCVAYSPSDVRCTRFACGDGTRTAGEACDDGNTTPGDGCSPACAVESGFACEGARPTACAVPSCGDATRTAGEACDDGNTTSGDGCSATCTLEGATVVPSAGATTVVTGALLGTAPTFLRPSRDCVAGSAEAHYDAVVLENADATPRAFDLTLVASGSALVLLYEAPFDATMPVARCLRGNDHWGAGHSRVEHVTLAPGAQTVAVITEADLGAARGPYVLVVDGR